MHVVVLTVVVALGVVLLRKVANIFQLAFIKSGTYKKNIVWCLLNLSSMGIFTIQFLHKKKKIVLLFFFFFFLQFKVNEG